jgi:hypothetical protein
MLLQLGPARADVRATTYQRYRQLFDAVEAIT